MAWFRRHGSEDADSLDPQVLLARAEAAQPPSLLKNTGFRMTVGDVFSIAGRGTVVTGQVASGTLAVGATVLLTRGDGRTRDVEVTGIEMFRKQMDHVTTGDNVGLLLHEVSRNDVAAGDVLTG
jgi:translation elongation factor EF-Tu-like GTPase